METLHLSKMFKKKILITTQLHPAMCKLRPFTLPKQFLKDQVVSVEWNFVSDSYLEIHISFLTNEKGTLTDLQPCRDMNTFFSDCTNQAFCLKKHVYALTCFMFSEALQKYSAKETKAASEVKVEMASGCVGDEQKSGRGGKISSLTWKKIICGSLKEHIMLH